MEQPNAASRIAASFTALAHERNSARTMPGSTGQRRAGDARTPAVRAKASSRPAIASKRTSAKVRRTRPSATSSTLTAGRIPRSASTRSTAASSGPSPAREIARARSCCRPARAPQHALAARKVAGKACDVGGRPRRHAQAHPSPGPRRSRRLRPFAARVPTRDATPGSGWSLSPSGTRYRPRRMPSSGLVVVAATASSSAPLMQLRSSAPACAGSSLPRSNVHVRAAYVALLTEPRAATRGRRRARSGNASAGAAMPRDGGRRRSARRALPRRRRRARKPHPHRHCAVATIARSATCHTAATPIAGSWRRRAAPTRRQLARRRSESVSPR